MFKSSSLTLLCLSAFSALAEGSTCQPKLQVDQAAYQVGESIEVQFAQCEGAAAAEDFLAIYDAKTDLQDIQGDANYRMWMWPCGTQFCHYPTDANTVVFGEKNNQHTWPLPPGSYKVHLIKRMGDEHGHFGSSSSSVSFVVEEKEEDELPEADLAVERNLNEEEDEDEYDEEYEEEDDEYDEEDDEEDEEEEEEEYCEDQVTMAAPCMEEGEAFSVLLQNECREFKEGDWFGFYDETMCDDDLCHGEPILWSWMCMKDDCDRTHIKYRFKNSDEFLLSAGHYRVVVVAAEDEVEDEDGAYSEPTLISRVFEVRPRGQSCATVWRES